MVVNPIPRASLWVTPESFEELQAMADACNVPSDAHNMMMLTFNYCRKLVEDQLLVEAQ